MSEDPLKASLAQLVETILAARDRVVQLETTVSVLANLWPIEGGSRMTKLAEEVQSFLDVLKNQIDEKMVLNREELEREIDELVARNAAAREHQTRRIIAQQLREAVESINLAFSVPRS